MQEFENLNKEVLKKINIISISSSSLTLEKHNYQTDLNHTSLYF